MNHPDYNSPASLKEFLEGNGMAMQKKFGQNFMINPSARSRIVDALEIGPESSVWEIGPGLGCMSEEIMNRGASLKVFEIDRGFISMLHQFFSEQESSGKFSIVEGDVLKKWKGEVPAENPGIRLFGNLPYNIAATFIADTIENGFTFSKCVFTVQKEVAQRICAKSGSKNYSSFSVLCQWKYDVEAGLVLSAGNFWPKPNVASQVVIMKPKKNPLECSSPKTFVSLVHALFSSRRKTIQNNIRQVLPPGLSSEELFEKTGISPSLRAENLEPEDFMLLSESISSAII
ncbi:MAG: ribosomal RNA small subunit methyltransferase A [Treponema sp.]|nr:ribosomal RNA small subunit methyltransferase A [Treponema sp.]MBQ5384590.1 ribosomal RNA small subunit methyltransferase A [Treponema sp.]